MHKTTDEIIRTWTEAGDSTRCCRKPAGRCQTTSRCGLQDQCAGLEWPSNYDPKASQEKWGEGGGGTEQDHHINREEEDSEDTSARGKEGETGACGESQALLFSREATGLTRQAGCLQLCGGFKILIYLLLGGGGVSAHARVTVWRSEDSFMESIASFCLSMSFGD